MKVHELITALQAMPLDADVLHLWDGGARTVINVVWLSRDGRVITSDYGMLCYPNNDRPPTAPTTDEELYWKTQWEASGVTMTAQD